MKKDELFKYDSPVGPLYGVFANGYVTALRFVNPCFGYTQDDANIEPPKRIKSILDSYFMADPSSLESMREQIRIQGGTDFQKKVWNKLLDIPAGTRVSYQTLAKKVNCPSAVRAIATACGKNPIHLVVPCHRVIRSSGALGGYEAGLDVKEYLLKHESMCAH